MVTGDLTALVVGQTDASTTWLWSEPYDSEVSPCFNLKQNGGSHMGVLRKDVS